MSTIFGICFGMLTIFIPALLWLKDAIKLTSEDFVTQYPDKKWVRYVHMGLPVFWILLYLLILFPLLFKTESVYLISFSIGGGVAVGHGIIEIISCVSMRNLSRFGSGVYVVDHSIRRLGWLRIGAVILLGLFPLLIISYS